MKRLETFHQRCLRHILRIRWYHRINNVHVLNRAGVTTLETIISSMRLRWFGHVSRMPDERLPKFLLDWAPKHGKRPRGRPKKSWVNCVREDAEQFTEVDNITTDNMKTLASDRKQWKQMIKGKREFLGAGHSND